MVDNLDITQNLKLLDLDRQEIKIYQTLLHEGQLSILNLSKKVNIPRSTVYRICEDLIERKFLDTIIAKNGIRVKSIHPKDLNFVIDKKKEELKKYRIAIRNLRSFNIKPQSKTPKTEVRYYQGEEGMKQLVWNTLKANKVILGYSIWGRDSHTGKDFERRYSIERKKRKINDKVIVNEKIGSEISQYINTKDFHSPSDPSRIRVIRKYPFKVSGDTYIYNNIYAVNFWNEDEIVGVEIENPEIVKVQKSIFEILWRLGETIK